MFEYASLPIEPENIVQSVNGNKPDANGNVAIETGGSVDESRLLPTVTSENTIVIGTSENKWGTTTKQEFLSDIDNRVSALESALGTVESSLDQIITGE